jgi:spermidine synthase
VYDCTTAKTIVDVGGAHGVLLAAALHANPVARGILFDLPYVIATAMDTVQAQGIADRCELVAGDFFEFVPAGADLYLLKNIIHDWDDEHNDRLLATCHSAIAPGGKLVVVEMVVPADNQPTAVQGMDLNMLVMAGGRERTAAEYQTLLAGAGFRLDRIIPTHSPYSIIESTRL